MPFPPYRPPYPVAVRRTLRHGVQILAGLFLSHGLAAGAGKPDILLIMPDQMRGDCLGAAGNPVVQTPHLDELAREGALFRRAYSTAPSCIPARFAFLTGRFPQTTGVVGFKARPIPYRTLPELLDTAGYATALVGRSMHQTPKTAAYGYEKIITGSTYINNDDYDRFLRQAAPATGGIRRLVARMGLTYNGWEAAPWPLPDRMHPTDWVAAQALKLLARETSNRPLFFTASFYAPHPPLFPPKQYFDIYLHEKLPAPARGDWVDWKSLPSARNLRVADRVRLEGRLLHRAQAGYYGLITQLDEQIAPLIAAFKRRSESKGHSWVILFLSDHGEMLGDHGYFRKCEPYEGSAHIPYIITGSPGLGFVPGLRCNQPVCLEDILPTLLDLAGAKIPPHLDGVSLVPILRGGHELIRHWLHLEHARCYSRQQEFQALTDGHFKYIWRPESGREQLFNLDQDPREDHDLATEKRWQPTLKIWRERMIQCLAGRPEGFTDGKRLIPGRPYPPLERNPLGWQPGRGK